MKSSLTISVDTETLIEARKKLSNISKTVNQALKKILEIKKEGTRSKGELEGEIVKSQALLAYMQTELESIREQEKKEDEKWRQL